MDYFEKMPADLRPYAVSALLGSALLATSVPFLARTGQQARAPRPAVTASAIAGPAALTDIVVFSCKQDLIERSPMRLFYDERAFNQHVERICGYR